ncbi:hypothetical protein ACP275_04G167400 [Erythranthe tilingii]
MSFCGESPSDAVSGSGNGSIDGGDCGEGEIMLFGVRVQVDPMRKSVSMNNLSEYEPVSNTSNLSEKSGDELPKAADDGGVVVGYASADDARRRPANVERKRGVPWTEEEHKLFLLGLQKVGKGDWRGISRNYVKTRTPTQVASHAQKYFLRRSNINRRRRRSSLFDITTDSVNAVPMEESRSHHQSGPSQPLPQPTTSMPPPPPVTSGMRGYSIMHFPVIVTPVLVPMQGENPMTNTAFGRNIPMNNSSSMFVHQVPVLHMPTSSTMIDLNLNQQLPSETSPLSLRLSLSSSGQVISSVS